MLYKIAAKEESAILIEDWIPIGSNKIASAKKDEALRPSNLTQIVKRFSHYQWEDEKSKIVDFK